LPGIELGRAGRQIDLDEGPKRVAALAVVREDVLDHPRQASDSHFAAEFLPPFAGERVAR
jgi:hypothetical protein